MASEEEYILRIDKRIVIWGITVGLGLLGSLVLHIILFWHQSGITERLQDKAISNNLLGITQLNSMHRDGVHMVTEKLMNSQTQVHERDFNALAASHEKDMTRVENLLAEIRKDIRFIVTELKKE